MRALRRPATPDLASQSRILIDDSYAGATLCRADRSCNARWPSAYDKNVESLSGIVTHPFLLPCPSRTGAGRSWSAQFHSPLRDIQNKYPSHTRDPAARLSLNSGTAVRPSPSPPPPLRLLAQRQILR